jgi:hypothetical protein
MESSGPSRNPSHHPKQGWAEVFGTIIALLTLTLPILAIAYYSQDTETLNKYPGLVEK